MDHEMNERKMNDTEKAEYFAQSLYVIRLKRQNGLDFGVNWIVVYHDAAYFGNKASNILLPLYPLENGKVLERYNKYFTKVVPKTLKYWCADYAFKVTAGHYRDFLNTLNKNFTNVHIFELTGLYPMCVVYNERR